MKGFEPPTLSQVSFENRKNAERVAQIQARQKTTAAHVPADLAAVVKAWAQLPEPIRRAVLALVETAK